MATKRPLDNTALTGMLIAGAALLGVGLALWAANTDFDYDPSAYQPGVDESSSAGQLFGMFTAGLGGMLLVLGWAAAVICRQLVDTRSESSSAQP